MNTVNTHDDTSDVAIIGMAGRFPGAATIAAFWQNLCAGVESISSFSDQDLLDAGIDPALLQHPHFVKAAPVLDGIEDFDATFFGITPREAEITDPQQRLFLECAWEALETAGYDPDTYAGAIGIYAGVGMNTYLLNNLYPNRQISGTVGLEQLIISNDKDFLTTRVAYKLNLRGPAITIQTACSTSLVAVHVACQSLLSGECDLALAGGASIRVPQPGYLYVEGSIMSPDGHCRPFDAQAKGTVFGNAVALVALKRLSDALQDGDHIVAVIKGSAVNNDGALKAGFTAPSVGGQAQVISEALGVAQIDPTTITYVEAHGTGTDLGDPIEITALTRAFGADARRQPWCAIGSLKSNMGHLDRASGVAGLMKTALALHHKVIPPSLHFAQPNPRIDFAHSPFYVNTVLKPWQTSSTPRRAAVSSLGIGGTNAHVVLEESPSDAPSGTSRLWQLLLLSARTSTALDTASMNLARCLQQQPDLPLADVAYTLQVGRRRFAQRRVVLCRDHADALAVLNGMHPERVLDGVDHHLPRSIAFLFPGDGIPSSAIAADLYQTEPDFRATVDQCAAILYPHLDLDIRAVLFPSAATVPGYQPHVARLSLFVLDYALARLWMAWGIQPQIMLGHSMGEVVAACLAGVMTLEDALRLGVVREHLMQRVPAGAMLAVSLAPAQLEPFLEAGIDLVAVNVPGHCVVAGTNVAIDQLAQRLTVRGIKHHQLPASPYHSAILSPILAEFEAHLRTIPFHPPQLPYISTVSGTLITAAEATDPRYWVRQLRHTVRFADGLAQILSDPQSVLIEVGPGTTLSTLAQAHPDTRKSHMIVPSLPPPSDSLSAAGLVPAVGQLWLAGIELDWAAFYAHERRLRVPLPTYPFERQRYWIDPPPHDAPTTRPASVGCRPNPADWLYLPAWNHTPLPASGMPTSRNGHWLVFLDAAGLGLHLAQRLEQTGQTVTTVTAGERFQVRADNACILHPAHSDEYAALVAHLRTQNRLPGRVIHLWALNDDQPAATLAAFTHAQYQGCLSLLWFVQALAPVTTEPLQFDLIATASQDVSGDEPLCPARATLISAGQFVAQEYPHLTSRMIDIRLPVPASIAATRLVDQLLAELAAPVPARPLAYRGYQRWEHTVAPIRQADMPTGQPALRPAGVYLFIGRLEGSTAVLADYLARTVQARIVCLQAPGFPPPIHWNHWLAGHADDDPVSRTIRQAQTLEQHGAQVFIIEAVLTSSEHLDAVISEVQQRFGTLHGVIYAPDDPHTTSGQERHTYTPTDVDTALQQEFLKLQALTHVLATVRLDWCILQSTLATVVGRPGMIIPAAQGMLVNTIARCQSRTSPYPWMSINWDTWQMEQPALTTISVEREQGITAAEGGQIFARLLASGPIDQVLVSPMDVPARLEQGGEASIDLAAGPDVSATGDGVQQATVHPRPNLANPYVAARNELEQTIVTVWEELLGIAPVGIYDNFFELGGHSLLATQVATRLGQYLPIELPLRRMFDAQTVADLAMVLIQALAEQSGADLVDQILNEVEQGDSAATPPAFSSDRPTSPAPVVAESREYAETNVEDSPSAATPVLVAHDQAVVNDAHKFDVDTGNMSLCEVIQDHRTLTNPYSTIIKEQTRQFYDTISAHLSSSVFGQYATFLNYGYVADGSQQYAPIDLPANTINRNSIKLILEVIGDCDLTGREILDVSCGRGGTLVTIAHYFRPRRLVGIDISTTNIAFCNQYQADKGILFEVGDADDLAFPADSFDVVTNIEASHLYPSIYRFYTQVFRVLRSGGYFLYTDLFDATYAEHNLPFLRNLGFVIEHDRDITNNVLRSCDEAAQRNLRAYTSEQGTERLESFLAVPDSQPYQDMQQRRLHYRILRLRKM